MSEWPLESNIHDHENWKALVQQFNKRYTEDDLKEFNRRICPPGCFPQSSGVWESIVVLLYAAEGAFTMNLLPPYVPPKDWIPDDLERRAMDSSYEARMNVLATLWLERERNVKDLEGEVEYPSGVADYASKDGRWYVECGGSRPSKVLDLYRSLTDTSLVFFNQIGVTIFGPGPRIKDYQEALRRSYSKSINRMKPLV